MADAGFGVSVGFDGAGGFDVADGLERVPNRPFVGRRSAPPVLAVVLAGFDFRLLVAIWLSLVTTTASCCH
jgi:hypothetical protein